MNTNTLPTSPNGGPSPADLRPIHPTVKCVAQAVFLLCNAGLIEDAQAFNDWLLIIDTDIRQRAREQAEEHLNEGQDSGDAESKAHDLLLAAIKACKDRGDWVRLDHDDAVHLQRAINGYQQRRAKRLEEYGEQEGDYKEDKFVDAREEQSG